MKKYIIIIISILLFSACTKEPESYTVRYEADRATTTLNLSYIDDNQELQEISHSFNSGEDIWSYQSIFHEGDIIYFSGVYSDEGGSQRLRILVDGKAWRQGENEFLPGEEGRITLSGILPFIN